MKDLKKFLTRDAPLVALEHWWYKGFTVHLKEFFNIAFPKVIIIGKNDTFTSYLDYGSMPSFTTKIISWFKKNKNKTKEIHTRLIDGLSFFRKTKVSSKTTAKEIFQLLSEAKEFFSKACVAVFAVHRIPIIHNQLIEEGKKGFDETLIKQLVLWREKEGNVFFNEGVDFFNYLLKEIANRTNYEMQSLKYLTFNEIKDLVIHKKQLPKNELEKRKKSVFMFIEGVIIYEKDINKLLEKKGFRLEKELSNDIQQIKGSIANKGYAKGKVTSLFSRTQLNKVKEGNILVAPMTFQWALPAMKKASAFVTDEGGITCHAAILSREMNKPCIIGTKIATDILKDGMEVEVDANKGVVRIIKTKF
ncbi:hypothetical protein GOV14_00500 [Candidatus Pacearchaeota archaeon]|nr:hypothetical protein [Candidatus Pacearchaeota archaeon]